MWNKFLAFFEKQRLLAETETIAGIIVLCYSVLNSYFCDFVKVWGEFLVLLEKQAVVTKAIGAEYLRLKSSFRNLVQKTIAALIVNRLFIALARLVQKIFCLRRHKYLCGYFD